MIKVFSVSFEEKLTLFLWFFKICDLGKKFRLRHTMIGIAYIISNWEATFVVAYNISKSK